MAGQDTTGGSACDLRKQFHTVFIEHSFILRLRDCVQLDDCCLANDKLWLDAILFSFSFHAAAGSCTCAPRSIQPVIDCLSTENCDINLIFFQIGGNDLGDLNREPQRVVNDIISLARYIHIAYNIPCIVIGESFQQFSPKLDPSYNTRVARPNPWLQQLHRTKRAFSSGITRVLQTDWYLHSIEMACISIQYMAYLNT